MTRNRARRTGGCQPPTPLQKNCNWGGGGIRKKQEKYKNVSVKHERRVSKV